MHFPLPQGFLPWVRPYKDSAPGRALGKTYLPRRLSQELSDLLLLTSGWLTLATASSRKASWEKAVGSPSPELLPSKFHTARCSLPTAGFEPISTSEFSGSQCSPFSWGSSLSNWILSQILLSKMYLSFFLQISGVEISSPISSVVKRSTRLTSEVCSPYLLSGEASPWSLIQSIFPTVCQINYIENSWVL